MRTVRTKIYKFAELSEEAKQTAIENLSYINVDHDWWDSVYMDAKNVGLQITGFDLDRNRHANGIFIESATECAYKILAQHGEKCETHLTAHNFIQDYNKLVEKYSDGVNTDIVAEENEYDFDNEADDLEQDFLTSILEDYSLILQKEYEYLTSEEAIIETIEANDYEFTQDGKIF